MCTVAQDGHVCIYVSLATLSVIPRVVKALPIWRGLAAVSLTVAKLHHSPTITLSIRNSTRLDGNARHMLTGVHLLHKFDITSGHLSLFSDDILFGWVQGPDCYLPIAKVSCSIVHNTLVVIGQVEMIDFIGAVLVEVVSFTASNVCPDDFHVVISVRSTLGMIETNCVQEFMFNCASTHAAI